MLIAVVATLLHMEQISPTWILVGLAIGGLVGAVAAIKVEMTAMPEMVALFADKTGTAFPWARYDQVVVADFVFGGMENVGCTTMTDLLLVSEAAALEWDPETLVAHELAHQWFGDLVTCIDWSHGWLNESWATFMESVWIDATRSEDEAIWYRYGLAKAYFAEARDRYTRPIVESRFREPIDVFDRHLYQKGASVLSTLRFRCGEEAFWKGVSTYLDRHSHGSVHTVHFLKAMEDATGDSLAGFFDEWIHTAGHPELDVALERDGDNVVVKVKQTQDEDKSRSAFTFDLVLDRVDSDGNTSRTTVRIDARERTVVLPGASSVRTVRVDPGFRVLASIELSGPREWLEALVMDDCPVLSVRAGKALHESGHPHGIEAVRNAARKHSSRFVREALMEIIGKRGGDAAEAFLIETLKAESDPRVRRAAADALGSFRGEAVADALREVIHSDPETPHLLGSALKSLGGTREEGVEDTIVPFVDEAQIADIEDRVTRAQIIDPKTLSGDKVVFGATVTLLDEDDKPVKYQIVGQTEADAKSGRISYNSPLGRALIGKTVGDEVEVTVPSGDKFYLVDKIEFI